MAVRAIVAGAIQVNIVMGPMPRCACMMRPSHKGVPRAGRRCSCLEGGFCLPLGARPGARLHGKRWRRKARQVHVPGRGQPGSQGRAHEVVRQPSPHAVAHNGPRRAACSQQRSQQRQQRLGNHGRGRQRELLPAAVAARQLHGQHLGRGRWGCDRAAGTFEFSASQERGRTTAIQQDTQLAKGEEE